ncbi:MAG: GNAT family N-acetyltransferase [Nitrososphaerota archaeon]
MSLLHPWAYERGTLWARACDGADIIPVIPVIEATLAEAHPEMADALAVAMGLLDSTAVRQRFSRGRRCFAAWVDGAIAAYGWVSRGVESIGELERTFHMSPDEAYIWDCATLPRYRGQHLYSALLTYLTATLCHDGFQRLWIGASLSNTPSIRGFATAGFQPVLRLTYRRLLGIRHVWIVGDPAAAPELVARACAALGASPPAFKAAGSKRL